MTKQRSSIDSLGCCSQASGRGVDGNEEEVMAAAAVTSSSSEEAMAALLSPSMVHREVEVQPPPRQPRQPPFHQLLSRRLEAAATALVGSSSSDIGIALTDDNQLLSVAWIACTMLVVFLFACIFNCRLSSPLRGIK